MSAYSDLVARDGALHHWGLNDPLWTPDWKDTFDGGDGEAPNPDVWDNEYGATGTGTGYSEIRNGKLAVLADNTASTTYVRGVTGRHFLTGDFSVEMELDSIVNTGTGSQIFPLIAQFRDEDPLEEAYIGPYKSGASVLWYAFDGVTGGQVARVNDYGKVRIQRVGSTVTLDYWTGSAWSNLRTRASAPTTRMTLVIRAQCNADGDSASGANVVGTIISADGIERYIALDDGSENIGVRYENSANPDRLRLAGKEGAAVGLNGTDQLLFGPTDDWRDTDTQGSIEAWFRTEATGDLTIFGTADEASNSWFSYLSVANGAIQFRARTSVDNHTQRTTASGFNDGKQHHVVVTSDGSEIKIYVDGALEPSTNTDGPNDGRWLDEVLNRDNFTVGAVRYLSGDVAFFNGVLDEIAYYSTALSATQIAEHYEVGRQADITYDERVLDDGPIAYWRLGDPPFADYTGNDFNDIEDYQPPSPGEWFASITNTDATFIDQHVLDGQLLMGFNNPASGWIYEQFNSMFELTGDFDIQIDVPEYDHVSGASNSYFELGAYTTDGGDGAYSRIHQNAAGSKFFQQEARTYLGVVQPTRTNDTGLRLRITRVGSLWTTYYDDNAAGWTSGDTDSGTGTGPVRILLMAFTAPTAANELRVKADNFVINSAGGINRRLYDDSAGPHVFAPVNSPVLASGLLATDPNKAVNLNGTTQYLERVVADWQASDTQGTVEAWINTSAAAFQCIFSSSDTATTDHFFGVLVTDTGTIRIQSRKAAVNNGIDTNNTFLGGIHHVVVKSDGSAWTIYVDGVLQATTVFAGSNNGDWLADVTNRDNVVIGGDLRLSLISPFDGHLDEAAYYDYPLTAAEILENYKAGAEMHVLLGALQTEALTPEPSTAQVPLLEYHDIVMSDGPAHFFHLDDALPDRTDYSMSDDFSNPGPAGFPDDSKWAILRFSPKVVSGKAVLSTTPDYLQLRLARLLQGDFSITFQWEVSQSLVAGQTFTFRAQDASGDGEYRIIYVDGNLGRITGSDGITFNYSSLYWDDGFFKIERIGTGAGAIKLYYKRLLGDAWIQRSSFTDFTLNDDAYIYVYTNVGTVEARVLDVQCTADSAIEFDVWRMARDAAGDAYVRNHLSDPVSGFVGSDEGASSLVAANSDYMEIQGGDITQPGLTDYTMECWARIDDTAGTKAIFGLGSRDVATEPGLTWYVSTKQNFAIDDGTSNLEITNSGPLMAVGQVYHLVVVIDRGNDEARMYQDGVLVGTRDITGLGDVTSGVAGSEVFGAYYDSGILKGYFDGDLDEIAIYDKVLDETRIKEHYRAGMERLFALEQLKAWAPGGDPDVWFGELNDYPALIVDQGGVFHIPLDDAAAPYDDVIGTADLTIHSTVNPGQGGLVPHTPDKQAISLTATGGLVSPTELVNPTQFAMSAIILTQASQGIIAAFADEFFTGIADRALYVRSDGKLGYGFYNGSMGSISSSRSVNDGLPHHIAVVHQDANAYLYVDGHPDGLSSGGATPANTTGKWAFGYAQDSGLPSLSNVQFQGIIDEIAYIGNTLVNKDIAIQYAHYRANDVYGIAAHVPLPIAYFRLDDELDPHWASVVCLLHLEGAQGATTFPDDTGKAVTNVGAQISRYQWRLNESACYLGAGDLTLAHTNDWDIIGGDYTVECWVKFDTLSAPWNCICSHFSNTGDGWRILVSDTGVVHFSTDDGTNNGFYSATGVVTTGQWYHIAAVGYAGPTGQQSILFVDGVRKSWKGDHSSTNPTKELRLGSTDGANWDLYGYLSEFRITKGVARYTGHKFDPPTRRLPSSRAFDTIRGRTFTTIPADVTREAPSLVWTGSGYGMRFDGTTDDTTRISMDLATLPLDFSVSMWIKPDLGGPSQTGVLLSKNSYFAASVTDFPFAVTISTSGTIQVVFSIGNDFTADLTLTGKVTLGVISHIVVVHNSNASYYLYINGLEHDSHLTGIGALSISTYSLSLGADPFPNGGGVNTRYLTNCVIDEVSIYEDGLTAGQVGELYAAGSKALVGDLYWNDVVLLCHFDEGDDSTSFVDEKGHTMTPNGATQQNVERKFGPTSGYFATTHDVDVTASADYGLGTGDWCVECWVFHTNASYTGAQTLFDFRTAVGDGIFYIQGTSGKWAYWNDTANHNTTNAVPANEWVHLAASYESGTLRLFINGALEHETTSHTFDFGASRPVRLGRHYQNTDGLTGYMDEVRITKGRARYTAAFTAPTVRFPEFLEATGTEVTLTQVGAEGLTNQLTTVPDAFQVALANLKAWAIAPDINYQDPALVVDLDTNTAEGGGSDVTVPNPGIAVGLQNAKGEATILKVNVVQGAVSAALLAARAEGTALMPPAINSAITLTLPRAEALPTLALAQVDLSGLISNIGAAISQAQVVPPIALVGGELAVIGAAQANGQAVNPSTLLAGLIATLSEAMADTSGVDMIGVASAITASLAQATAEQIAKGLLTQLGGAAVTLPSTAGEALSSDVAVTIDFAAINIGAIDALAETNGPNISLGDFQAGLDAAVALGFTPEVTVTVDFGPGEIEKESLVYRFQLEDVVYKITYASAVALKNRASMVMRKDEESDVKMATYGDDVYQSTQDNEV